MRVMLKLAGGGSVAETNLGEFIQQAYQYREGGDLADQVFKVLNLLGANHPFPVLRVAEMRDWFQSGDYDRILRGEYRRRGEPESAYLDDLTAAGRSYAESARTTLDTAAQAARQAFRQIFQNEP
jgi:hypothetical protein